MMTSQFLGAYGTFLDALAEGPVKVTNSLTDTALPPFTAGVDYVITGFDAMDGTIMGALRWEDVAEHVEIPIELDAPTEAEMERIATDVMDWFQRLACNDGGLATEEQQKMQECWEVVTSLIRSSAISGQPGEALVTAALPKIAGLRSDELAPYAHVTILTPRQDAAVRRVQRMATEAVRAIDPMAMNIPAYTIRPARWDMTLPLRRTPRGILHSLRGALMQASGEVRS